MAGRPDRISALIGEAISVLSVANDLLREQGAQENTLYTITSKTLYLGMVSFWDGDPNMGHSDISIEHISSDKEKAREWIRSIKWIRLCADPYDIEQDGLHTEKCLAEAESFVWTDSRKESDPNSDGGTIYWIESAVLP